MPTFTSEVDKIAKYSLVKCIKMSNIGNYKRKYDINVRSSEYKRSLRGDFKDVNEKL